MVSRPEAEEALRAMRWAVAERWVVSGGSVQGGADDTSAGAALVIDETPGTGDSTACTRSTARTSTAGKG
ncbi:hypothetical protein BOTBODRAFT_256802 [Botryobasidium botryosum FD-172 SS1]|uniref:Uncharacterized protein n=1 Tax=Botryobasidium botryosum (strain FD-172 SS1) TaxID=930990 RepID=A0A067MWD1_BOTB1|nr:hypothetical protein BOTBODRAFT_256802 [Botryobasidium botryosum FD-172 SS1]